MIPEESATQLTHSLTTPGEGREPGHCESPGWRSDAGNCVDHVAPGTKIFYEEKFDPVTTVVRVQGINEAIAAADNSAYGLPPASSGAM